MSKTEIQLTPEMKNIFDTTQDMFGGNMYVTGKAGTGKTTLLKYLVENSRKKIVVTASTGIAAVNAGGCTLHSLFMIPFGPQIPGGYMEDNINRDKRRIMKGMELLIIDEVSMVRPDILDFVDARLRDIRDNDRPFGGVQVVMFGDLYQLPPVLKGDDADILKNWYDTPYFFSAQVWKRAAFRAHELTKVFRQTDEGFVNILNHIRDYQTVEEDFVALSSIFGKPTDQEYNDTCIHLCAYKNSAEYINNTRLGTEGLVVYEAEISGKFPDSSLPCPKAVTLRKGARVMSLVNDSAINGNRFYNGSLGIVEDLTEYSVKVKFDSGDTVDFSRYIWKNNEYRLSEDKKTLTTEEVGSCIQIPLVAAWAITIHKSQGLSFDKVYLHVGRVFSPGQLYVALSRCRSFEGLRSDTMISRHMVIPDQKLLEFDNYMKTHDNFWYQGNGDIPVEKKDTEATKKTGRIPRKKKKKLATPRKETPGMATTATELSSIDQVNDMLDRLLKLT